MSTENQSTPPLSKTPSPWLVKQNEVGDWTVCDKSGWFLVLPSRIQCEAVAHAHNDTFRGRPRIHNIKMLRAIYAIVLEHSGNEQLAESVRKYLSAELSPSEVMTHVKQLRETLEYARYWIGWLTSRGLHDHLYPVNPHEQFTELCKGDAGFGPIDKVLAASTSCDTHQKAFGGNMTVTFLLELNLDDLSTLSEISANISDDLSANFDVISVKPWARPTNPLVPNITTNLES